jgi:hypothetical protein
VVREAMMVWNSFNLTKECLLSIRPHFKDEYPAAVIIDKLVYLVQDEDLAPEEERGGSQSEEENKEGYLSIESDAISHVHMIPSPQGCSVFAEVCMSSR